MCVCVYIYIYIYSYCASNLISNIYDMLLGNYFPKKNQSINQYISIYILLKTEAWHLLLLSSYCATSSPCHSPHNNYLLFILFFFYKKKIIDFTYSSLSVLTSIYFFFISNFPIIFFTFTYFLNIYTFFNLSSSLIFSSPHYLLL